MPEHSNVETMKAAYIEGYGGVDALQYGDLPKPTCEPNDILVRVHCAAINPVDWKMCQGTQSAVIRMKFPRVLGMDVSGVVEAVGDKVTRFKVGDEVFSSPIHTRQGTYAEYVAIHEDEAAPKPSNMTHAEAASIPLVGLTAWNCIVDAINLRKGQSIFIEAGAGGVGSFAIQLARYIDAEVSTTCSARNADFVRSLGADRPIDYNTERFEDVLSDLDAAVECMGKDSPQRILSIMKRGGHVASINAGMYNNVKVYGPYLGTAKTGLELASRVVRSRICKGVHVHNVIRKPDGQALARIAELIEAGHIQAHIDKVFPLHEVRAAHTYNQEGHTRGKIVLQVV